MLDFVYHEATKLLSDAGYEHLRLQIQELARHSDPTHSETLDIKGIEDFHELRDHCGALCGLNVRLFFGIDHQHRAIVPLGVIQKQNNGPTPQVAKIRMRGRWRKYLNGEYGFVDFS